VKSSPASGDRVNGGGLLGRNAGLWLLANEALTNELRGSVGRQTDEGRSQVRMRGCQRIVFGYGPGSECDVNEVHFACFVLPLGYNWYGAEFLLFWSENEAC